MKDHLVTFIIGFITLAIGAFLGYYTDMLTDKNKNKIQFLDIKVSKVSESLKEISTNNGKNIELVWKGKKISSVSNLIIDFYNFSDLDFDETPVYLDIYQPFAFGQEDIISIRGTNNKGIEDHLIMDGYPKTLDDGTIKYAFKLGVLNRATTNSYDPSYKINIILKGSYVPDAIVSINQKGVEKRDFDPLRFNDLNRDHKKDFIPILIVIAFLIFITWVTIRDRKNTLKYFIKLSKKYEEYFKENANNIDLKDDASIHDLSVELVQEIRMDIWKNKSRMDKILLDRSPPKKEDIKELID